MNGHSFSYTY